MTGTGTEEMLRGSGKKYSIQRGVSKKFLILERGSEHFCVLRIPKNPMGGNQPWSDFILFYLHLNLDEIISAYYVITYQY